MPASRKHITVSMISWARMAALALAIGLSGMSPALGDSEQPLGPHGGTLQRSQHFQFETVFARDGLRVFPFTVEGKPLDASALSGTATFYHPNSPNPWFVRALRPSNAGPGQTVFSLELKIGLRNVPATGAKVAFEIKGLPDPAETMTSLTVPFSITPPPKPAAITYARAAHADQAAINAQRVCKVSGEPLGSMGSPLKVSRGDQSIFLCCQGCLRAVQANPDRFFGPSEPTRAK